MLIHLQILKMTKKKALINSAFFLQNYANKTATTLVNYSL